MRKFFINFITILTFILFTSLFGIIAYYLYQHLDPARGFVAQASCNGQIMHAYFSPEDNIKDKLINLIDHEKKSISVAIYTITHKEIAQSLINAYLNGINVEIVTDKSYGSGSYSKIPMLANRRIPVWVYQTPESLSGGTSKQWALMHNKFIIFEENIDNKSLLCTGSFNFTKSANKFNQENIIVTDNVKIISQFQNNFEKLKSLSLLISGKINSKQGKYQNKHQKSDLSWMQWILKGEWINILAKI